jgi:hypothetical protein
MTWFIPVMKKLNPGWSEINNANLYKDGATGWTTIHVARGPFDISPVRALRVDAIQLLACSVCDLTPVAKSKVQSFGYSTFPGYSCPLRDISLLPRLPLKVLDLSGAPDVADLSPLAGMKLESISFHYNARLTDIKVVLDMPITSLTLPLSISDLRPFKGMKLKSLGCWSTDISPVAGMPLEAVYFGGFRPADLSLLAGMKLKHFAARPYRTHYEPDEKMLRAMPLETINGQPAAQFWAAQDAAKKALQEFVAATAKLTPEEAAGAVKEAFKKEDLELGGGKLALLDSRIADGAVIEAKVLIHIDSLGRAPLAPLKAFSNLKKLTIVPHSHDSWTDLSPVLHLPIEEIVCNPGMIAGNTIILRQMPMLKTINGKPAKEVLAAVK